MLLYLKLAWRNIWRNKRRTLISISSVTFAVLLAVSTQSLNRGSHDHMIDNMARFHTGFIQVQDSMYDDEPSLDHAMPFDDALAGRIRGSDNRIDFLIPRIETYALVASEDITRGGILMGIDPEREHRLNGVQDHLVEGRFFDQGDETLVIGERFAGRLNVSIGDTLVLLGQGRFGMTAAGKYAISGLIRHPISDIDNQIAYISLHDAQWLFSAEGHVTSLLVTPTQVRHYDQVAESIRRELGHDSEFAVLTWPEMMPELLQAIEFDNAGGHVVTGILYIVIAFGLFGTILTMTLERMREFGVLLSVGMQRVQLAGVVFLETFFISLLGVLAGFVLSFLLLIYFYLNPVELSGDAAGAMLAYGFEPILPVSLAPDLFYSQMIIIFLIAIVISLYPALKIIRLNILEAART